MKFLKYIVCLMGILIFLGTAVIIYIVLMTILRCNYGIVLCFISRLLKRKKKHWWILQNNIQTILKIFVSDGFPCFLFVGSKKQKVTFGFCSMFAFSKILHVINLLDVVCTAFKSEPINILAFCINKSVKL